MSSNTDTGGEQRSGERERIARIAKLAPVAGGSLLRGTGDDCSVVQTRGTRSVTSIDAVVDGVHFERDLFTAGEVGYKAVAGAVSDLAAMGAEAGEVYVAMGVPGDVDETEFDRLRDGVLAAAADVGALLAGGDLTASPVLWLAVTAVGYASGETALVGRDGARPGDVLVVTDNVGGAGAGLAVMRGLSLGLPSKVAAELKLRQTHPQPRLAAGQALAAAGATAMIDLSDGIAKDAGEIAAASNVRLEVRLADLPVQPGVTDVAGHVGIDLWHLAAAAGEDYELLAALPVERLAGLGGAVGGTPLTVVGEVLQGSGVGFFDADGAEVQLSGYEHFGDSGDSPAVA